MNDFLLEANQKQYWLKAGQFGQYCVFVKVYDCVESESQRATHLPLALLHAVII